MSKFENLYADLKKTKNGKIPSNYKTLQEVIDVVEKEYIYNTLVLTNWNIQKASRVLNVARNTLKAKMKKHNITPPDSYKRGNN